MSLLERLDLASDVNAFPDYSEIMASTIRNKPYTELWKGFLQDGLYDVRLVDESFIQFIPGATPSFSFYDAPVKALSFEAYAADQLGAQWRDGEYRDLVVDLRTQYDEYLSSLDFERPATPVRYDYSPAQYQCACHPAAHLHFGFSSEVRLAVRRAWNPEAFVMFIVRQFFPQHWNRYLDEIGREDAKGVCAAVRENLDLIGNEHWGDRHEAEVYLT